MPRYIEQLNENTTPATGDWLWIVDVSAGATDQDRKLSVGKLALLATANVFTAAQTVNLGGAGSGASFVALSGDAAYSTRFSLGRTTQESFVGIANATDAFMTGSAAGDTVITTSSVLKRIFIGAGNGAPTLVIDNGHLLIGTTTDSGQLTVDQSASDGAIPVLVLDQADADEDFIEFVGTSGTGTSVSISTTAEGAFAGKFQITVNGDKRWVSFT